MSRRKIRDAVDARRCLEAVEASGLDRAEWARQQGVDGRSLNAWRLNLLRGAGTAPLRLVELVAPLQPMCGRYVVHVDKLSVEVDDGFREDTLVRLLRVVSAC